MTKPAHGVSQEALPDVDGWKIGGLPDNVLIDLTFIFAVV